MFLLYETTRQDGTFERVHLRADADSIILVNDEGEHALPANAIERVMARYGRELEGEVPKGDSLALGGGALLVRFRYLATFDVIAKDYVVYVHPGKPAVCELAASVCAALSHLARALRA